MNNFFLLEKPDIQFFLFVYFIAISIITFFYFGWDKMRAELNKRRVSEKMLWILSLLGGSLSALLAMHFFRHKTKKFSFQAGMAIILMIQILFAIWLFKK